MEISSINKPRQEEQGHSHQAPDKEDKENFKDNKNFRQNFKMKPTTSAILILTILGFSASIQAFHVERVNERFLGQSYNICICNIFQLISNSCPCKTTTTTTTTTTVAPAKADAGGAAPAPTDAGGAAPAPTDDAAKSRR